jgi:hypothetical protein
MFGKSETDLRKTLEWMREETIDECRHDQYAAQRRLPDRIKQDRRFDNLGVDPVALAEEAFKAKATGRPIRLAPEPYRTNPMPATYTGR